MDKDLNNYKLIIVDMDGTLYHQRPVRIAMALKLFMHIVTRGISGIRDVKMVSEFRRKRENEALSKDVIVQSLSKKYSTSAEYTDAVITDWLMKIPLSLLPKYKNEALCKRLLDLQKNGIKVVVFSDYPADDKCRVLGLSSFDTFHADQPEIGELKPSPKGILYIMEKYGITDKSQVIMIGDRESRDGMSADRAGCDKMIVTMNSLTTAHSNK